MNININIYLWEKIILLKRRKLKKQFALKDKQLVNFDIIS